MLTGNCTACGEMPVDVTWPCCRHFNQLGQLQVEAMFAGKYAEYFNKGEIPFYCPAFYTVWVLAGHLKMVFETVQHTWSGNQALEASPGTLFSARRNVTHQGLIYIL